MIDKVFHVHTMKYDLFDSKQIEDIYRFETQSNSMDNMNIFDVDYAKNMVVNNGKYSFVDDRFHSIDNHHLINIYFE